MGSERDHERIWLEPCACDPKAERTWCHHSTVYDPCEECGAPPTEYVRADLVWGDRAIVAAYARGAREMRTQAISTAHKLGATRTADAIRALPDTPEGEAAPK